MTDNTLAATAPEALNDEAESTETPEVVEPAATDGAETPAEPTPKTPEQLELERLRRALTKRDRTQGKLYGENEQLRARLAELEAKQPAPTDAAETKPAPVSERDVLTLAERIAAQKEFTAKCNSVAEKGRGEFKDFPDALNALIEEAGPLVTNKGEATELGEMILETENAHALIHYLGKNPDLAAELEGLKGGRLARKLVILEDKMNEKPKTSSAPKPLAPLKGAASLGDLASVVDDPDEWRKRRNAQLAKRR